MTLPLSPPEEHSLVKHPQIGGVVEDVGGSQSVLEPDLPLVPLGEGLLGADDQDVRDVVQVLG